VEQRRLADIAAGSRWNKVKPAVKFQDFVKIIGKKSNQPLNLRELAAPFGITLSDVNSPDLLVGHVLDELALTFVASDMIDCLDVATAAWELGHDSAGALLSEIPEKMAAELRARGEVH
jgi:hypothetical protein